MSALFGFAAANQILVCIALTYDLFFLENKPTGRIVDALLIASCAIGAYASFTLAVVA